MLVGGEPLEVRAEADGLAGTRAARRAATGHACSQQRDVRRSRRRAGARSVSSGVGEVPRPAASRRSGRPGPRRRPPPAPCSWTAATLPAPPHCALSRPPGRSAAASAREQRVVVGDPVEDRVGEDGVDRLAVVERERRAGRPGARRRVGRAAPRARGRPSPASASTATTRPRGRRSSSSRVTRPEPQPASSTVSSPRSSRRSRTSRAHATCGLGDPVVGVRVPGARGAQQRRRDRPAALAVALVGGDRVLLLRASGRCRPGR